MARSDSNIDRKRNPWVLPGLILWGFTPAILISTNILGGWSPGELGVIAPAASPLGELLLQAGLFGMPIILYPWSVVFLLRFGAKPPTAYGFGILLTPVMCAVNLFLGMTGCNALSNIVPKEGIF